MPVDYTGIELGISLCLPHMTLVSACRIGREQSQGDNGHCSGANICETGFLAGEAALDSTAVAYLLKIATQNSPARIRRSRTIGTRRLGTVAPTTATGPAVPSE
jgi:hypothetical protein